MPVLAVRSTPNPLQIVTVPEGVMVAVWAFKKCVMLISAISNRILLIKQILLVKEHVVHGEDGNTESANIKKIVLSNNMPNLGVRTRRINRKIISI